MVAIFEQSFYAMSARRTLAFVLIAAASLGLLEAARQIALGPFQFLVKEAEDCENAGKYPIKLIGNKIRKFNRTAYCYNGNFVTRETIDNDLKITVRLAVFGNGGWKKNFFVVSAGSVCDALMKFAPKLWKTISEMIDQTCPIPPGNYTIKDLPSMAEVNWPSLPVDTYKVTAEASRGNRIKFCKIFLVDVIPKRHRM